MIELYDLGRTTHRAVEGMYEFIVQNAHKYIKDPELTKELVKQAKNREIKGHSIPQEYFTLMCGIWTQAVQSGDFTIDLNKAIYQDTIPRFKKVKQKGRDIGILTSASKEFTDILYRLQISPTESLSDYVDSYFIGQEMGDKDYPETFANLWEKTQGGIYAVFDDKPSVCRSAVTGFKSAGGSANIYLVDRKNQYSNEQLEELVEKGVRRITSFNEVED